MMRAVWTQDPVSFPTQMDPGGDRATCACSRSRSRRSRSGSAASSDAGVEARAAAGWLARQPRDAGGRAGDGAAPARGAAGMRRSPSRCACGGTARSRTGCARTSPPMPRQASSTCCWSRWNASSMPGCAPWRTRRGSSLSCAADPLPGSPRMTTAESRHRSPIVPIGLAGLALTLIAVFLFVHARYPGLPSYGTE